MSAIELLVNQNFCAIVDEVRNYFALLGEL